MKKPMQFPLAQLLYLLIIGICCNCQYMHSQTVSPFQFLRVNQSARAAALGGAFVQYVGDGSAVFFNPASISTVEDKSLSLAFQKHVLDINSGMCSYVGKVGNSGSWAGAISYASLGSFQGRDNNGNATSSFSANNISLGATYSNMIDSLFYYGVGVNFISASIANASTQALSINAGLLYQIPKSRVNIGLSILHLGTQLSQIGDYSDKLPLDVRLGISHRLRGLPLLFNFSLNNLAEDKQNVLERLGNFSVGGEFYFGKVIEVRIGYSNAMRNGTGFESQARLSGISAGVGLKIRDINVDYAFTSMTSSAVIHRLSIATGL